MKGWADGGLEINRFEGSYAWSVSRVWGGVYVECAGECVQRGGEYIDDGGKWKWGCGLVERELYCGCG
jgi:hypothetical protein